MTAGFLSVPIMRPNHCWTILHVCVLTVLLLTLNADSQDSNCETAIKVRRNTHHAALLGQRLVIDCPVHFCNNSTPTVSWFKNEKTTVPVDVSSGSHIRTEWKQLNHSDGISHLIFQNILMSDSGVYQCRSDLIVSHNINVSVFDHEEPANGTQRNETGNTNPGSDPPTNLWTYVYTAAGILASVIIVIIISVLSMQGCKGKPKKEIQSDNQYIAIPMVEQPLPRTSLQAPPRGSPSAPPSRKSTRRKTPPPQPSELPLPRDNQHLYSKTKENRGRQRNTAQEEGSSVVYAALNHQPPAGAAARPRIPREESSEYAAIRIPGH
ncbi:B- and T-lymphocyte attenuator-like isoform X2 [Chelmon rostratus]|uniref:B- and T-lymphocyte attenuator-like isoform X2 n=1 Tax=Chelmon rostratus TaxID=109905 RepID=UPI001BE7075A|nr:B- and T-lymphocyte attenuator-like isoform X2 [Chelmon rostratus]